VEGDILERARHRRHDREARHSLIGLQLRHLILELRRRRDPRLATLTGLSTTADVAPVIGAARTRFKKGNLGARSAMFCVRLRCRLDVHGSPKDAANRSSILRAFDAR
jgi:hypothetical protein